MSAHNSGCGPRSNAYSANRFTNWSEYESWWLEIQAVLKRFDGKIAKRPAFPKIALRQFYLRDVLMHEIGHHLDTWSVTRKDRERFADEFAKKHR